MKKAHIVCVFDSMHNDSRLLKQPKQHSSHLLCKCVLPFQVPFQVASANRSQKLELFWL